MTIFWKAAVLVPGWTLPPLVAGSLACEMITAFGLTTLPRDRALLERRVRDSLRGFEKVHDEQPRGETYIFVLEDLAAGQVVGTSGIVSKVGGFEPFYAYQIKTQTLTSKTLSVRKQVRSLNLVAEHNGPSEIGSLFLHPDYRKDGNGRTLSLMRFMFMADFPRFFDPVVIAEMRGVIDEHGHSPFWDAVGKHFFDLEFPKADYLSIVNKEFIGDLMPRHPIYIPLLPAEAQAVIGQVHDQTVPALKILQAEGFAFSGMVDIFEAGPIMRCARDDIRTLRTSTLALVAEVVDDVPPGPAMLLSNCRRQFRGCQTTIGHVGHDITITRETAAALQVRPGDTVRYAALRATAATDTAAARRTQEHAR